MSQKNDFLEDVFPFQTVSKLDAPFSNCIADSNAPPKIKQKKPVRTSTRSTTTSTTTTTSISTTSKSLGKTTETTPPEPPGIWEYLDEKTKNWIAFDSLTTRLVEATCKRDMQTCPLNHGEWCKSKGGWLIDFGILKNTEKATGKQIDIRRVPVWKGKYYGTGKQIERKELLRSDELKVPHYNQADEELKRKIQKLTGWTVLSEIPKEDTCPICMSSLRQDDDQELVVKLSRCNGHFFHVNCITHCGTDSFVCCPICGEIYGTRIGTMPKGTMNVSVLKGTHCAGHEKYDAIQIHYSFPNGIQGPEHPSPGQPYTGTSRNCYLPDNEEGREILELYKVAWERRLLFRIGTSVTSGTQNTTVWAIHHRTSLTGGPTAFGYPDPGYFLRVKSELAQVGVTVKDLKKT